MKHLIVIICFFISISANAQTSVNYTEIVKVDSISAKVLFERARAWFVASFHDSKNVLEINDKESGELAGKGSIKATYSIMGASNWPYGYLYYHISISTKDGKYKVQISSYRHEYNTIKGGEQSYGDISDNDNPDRDYEMLLCGDRCKKKLWNDLQKQCIDNNKELIASLKKAMLSTAGSDW